MNGSREVWITDPSHPKFQKIKASFVELMQEHTKELKINYYDFLLVAKKMAFRFEESAHLMALKNFFAKNRNSIPVKRIADALCVSQESLSMQEDKVIVKFNVPDTEFAPIKEETLEDDELAEESDNEENFKKMGSNITQDQQKEINEKMAIILSIKIDQMEQKLQQLLAVREPHSIFSLFEDCQDDINYERFKKGFLSIVATHKERIRISEDDIKTIFYILDESMRGSIDLTSLAHLKNLHWVLDKMREFYKARINRDMVKNTLFKLGRIKNNSIQIYQVKNASLLEFENIERSMLPDNEHRKHVQSIRMRNNPPHFGPLKGAVLANRKQKIKANTIYHSNQQIRSGEELKLERQKIERILKLSKQEKHREKGGDTVASKLRSLFIHKVILPREKMLEEEKERYLKNRTVESDLFVKAHR